MEKLSLLGLLAWLFSAVGCATASRAGNALSRATVVLHNTAGRNITIVPTNNGEAYPAFRREKRKSQLLQRLLGDKKIPVDGVAAIDYGGHLRVPLVANVISWSERRMTVKLIVLEKNRLVGTYFYCVTAPVYSTPEVPLVFDRWTLEELRKGNHGEPCGHQLWRY